MNTAIGDQPFQGLAGNLSPDRIKSGEDDRFGSIVNDDIYSGGGFNRPDIPAFTADDPSLHLFVRQRHDGNGFFSDIITGIPGNGQGDDVLCLFIGLHLHFIFNLNHHLGGFHPGFTFDAVRKLFFRFFAGYPGNFFKLNSLLFDNQIDFFLTTGQSFFLPGKRLFFFQKIHFPLVQKIHFPFNLLKLLNEFLLFLKNILLQRLDFPFSVLLQGKSFILALQDSFFFNLLCFGQSIFNKFAPLRL